MFRAAMPRRFAILFLTCLSLLAACDRKPAQQEPPSPTPAPQTPAPTPVPTPTPPPTPTPTPTPYVPQKILQTGEIFNGVKFKTHFETLEGSTATADREKDDSYTVEVTLKVKVPKPHQRMEDLKKLNPKLNTVLPGLGVMLEKAKVSLEFEDLYRRKVDSVRGNLNRLDQVLSRHNFYDCETILQLEHPETKRRVLLIQSDMDVDTDGSDGDRLIAADGSQSKTYQPFTSYRWDKRTKMPNPCVAIWQKKIAANDAKEKTPGISANEKTSLRADTARLKKEIKELEGSSYLMGVADPFIVLPTTFFARGKTGYTPAIGNYCAVIVDDVIYPAILGDAGPRTKIGEASLRLCQEINSKSNAAFRSVSDLKATYLVFIGTGDTPRGPPDYELWEKRCAEYLAELGGTGGRLHKWTDITKSAAPPPPAPTPAPAVPAEPTKPAEPPPAAPE